MRLFLRALVAGFFTCILAATAQTKPPSVPMGAGGLGDPLVVTSLRLVVGHPDYGGSRQRLAAGRKPAPVTAIVVARGGGMISGRWELATPADGAPTDVDLTPVPMLSAQNRQGQRNFRQLGTFSLSLSPGDRQLVAAPVLEAKDLTLGGRYYVLLRIDTASSLGSGAPKLPGRIAPAVFEVDMARAAPASN